ncbi:hypothetical protein [Mycolicibacterium hippocampi]|uniref:hypothetical protein n=1 Tax=Mycobacteriaceae TaxID=1762 RepID=UPI0015B50F3C|nr:hypothetical protein [Mycolicibacterium hippocampi]
MAAVEPHSCDEPDDFSDRLDQHLGGIRDACEAIAASQQRILALIDLIDDRGRS